MDDHIVAALWRAFDTRNWAQALGLLADDFVADWPQTSERIRGADAFIALNAHAPGRWRCHLQELIQAGERAVSRVLITNGEDVVHAISRCSEDPASRPMTEAAGPSATSCGCRPADGTAGRIFRVCPQQPTVSSTYSDRRGLSRGVAPVTLQADSCSTALRSAVRTFDRDGTIRLGPTSQAPQLDAVSLVTPMSRPFTFTVWVKATGGSLGFWAQPASNSTASAGTTYFT